MRFVKKISSLFKRSYTVTFKIKDENGGSITGNTPQNVKEGESCKEVTANPNTGYNFINWTSNAIIISKKRTFIYGPVSKSITIFANFQKIEDHNYKVEFKTSGDNGSITGNTPQKVKEGEYSEDVTANPNAGYKFMEWTSNNDFVSEQNPLTYGPVWKSITLYAKFGKISWWKDFSIVSGMASIISIPLSFILTFSSQSILILLEKISLNIKSPFFIATIMGIVIGGFGFSKLSSLYNFLKNRYVWFIISFLLFISGIVRTFIVCQYGFIEPIAKIKFVRVSGNSSYHKNIIDIGSFWLGKHEVTKKQWRKIMKEDEDHSLKNHNHPKVMVKWKDAKEFITKLNKKTEMLNSFIGKKDYRFPTEDEWEYACTNYGMKEEELECSNKKPHPSHAKGSCNDMTLYDMMGNVKEWCEDEYIDDKGKIDKTRRVVRGGDWNGPKKCSLRYGKYPDSRAPNIGFRIAAGSDMPSDLIFSLIFTVSGLFLMLMLLIFRKNHQNDQNDITILLHFFVTH